MYFENMVLFDVTCPWYFTCSPALPNADSTLYIYENKTKTQKPTKPKNLELVSVGGTPPFVLHSGCFLLCSVLPLRPRAPQSVGLCVMSLYILQPRHERDG